VRTAHEAQQLINEIVVDEPDPAAAHALQEGLDVLGVLAGWAAVI
jgi:hypothetical protein